MTDGIGRLSGYGNYGVGGYMPQRRNEMPKDGMVQDGQVAAPNYEDTQVDPSKVMDFLTSNNFFIATPQAADVDGVDSATQDRIAGYMEQFEMIYGVVQEEFGEEIAPAVMDVVMDKLMGMS